jgi:signal transduction histidine kinase/DNA-binding response OmpR family regulator/streptogramin lyase
MFDYIGFGSLHHNVIGQCCVMSIYNDNLGNMYVGTDNDGIYVLDSCYNLKQHFECDKPNTYVPMVTLSMCCDSYQRLWVGGYLGGLVWLDLKTGIWHRYEQATLSAGNEFSSVYSIVEDSVTQTLWISASGIGIYKINEKTLESKLFTVNYTSLRHNYTTNQICNPWVINMMISSDRKLYIGTFSGFSCMDLDTESFINTYGVNCFMEGYVVNSICESPDHHIWIGTTEGLYEFDVKTSKFRIYETKDGLINTSVSGVSADADGNIWISSKAGISCLYHDNKNIVNFNSSDGLYSNEFMSNAVSKAQNGKISFGAVNGVVCFSPFAQESNKNNFNLKIVNFVVDNKVVSKGVKSGGYDVVDTSVVHAKRFHLSPWDNSFEIEFSVMVYGNSDNIKYSYCIDDGEWSTISGNRVSFAKMGYGVHTLKARATDNVNTSQELSVEIVIDYPWYRSTWFYMLLILLGICSAILTYVLVKRRIQLNRHLEELSHDKELNDSRLEYFTNISHEIRTPISLIISPLYKLLNSDLDPVRQRSYKVINVNAQRILNLINQLLDLRKIDSAQLKLEFEKTDLVSFCKGIYESFELYASNLGVKFELETEEDSIDAYIDPKHFDKVIVNLLSNAFKYTPANGKVTLSLVRQNDNMVEISVTDEGSGLSEEDADHIFDLFYQGSNNHKITMVGTGVGMFLARKLVTMHHGTIKATNNPEGSKGCSFVINLPLGRAHLTDDEIYVRSEQDKMKYMPLSGMDTIDDEELKQYAKTSTRIVLVDDDDQMRQYIIDELGKYFHFTDFAKATEALMYITKNKPDLVISDVMMDDMNGMTLCKKIKQNVEINTIPVILLTAAAQDNSRIKALDLGADAYITKPFNISVLSHTITNLLKRNNTLKNNYLGRQVRTTNVKDDSSELNSPDDKLLQRVLKVIDENMSNQNLTVNMIAETVGISRVHLHRKLKELTNQSTIDFLRNVRLNKALKLLRIKHISILEVAQQVGFGSTSYFSAVFKERFGCTPSAYMTENFNVEVDTNLPDDVTKMFQNL